MHKYVRESQPWSNSWPSGDDERVRRACFPSVASSVAYTHVATPMKMSTHAGGSSVNVGAYQNAATYEQVMHTKPIVVIALGASHSG
jgi:hypothetical protein